mmetsp:Transcript_10510/g.10571  ORF Transcript_10510/g.10571 Transcript_10510/m.10571 type:complete len:130 (+) Transcript_10510:132-521(+)
MDRPIPIDREKVCPFLLRCFWKLNQGYTAHDYRDKLPENEFCLYTWPDASLREIATLMKDVIPEASQSNAFISFSIVYPDRNGINAMKPIGRVRNSREGPDDHKTLSVLPFQTGDYLDVAVYIAGNPTR